MKALIIISLLVSLSALAVTIWQGSRSVNQRDLDIAVNRAVIEREREIVRSYKPTLNGIERDMGVPISNPTTFDEMGQSMLRIIFMPQLKGDASDRQ